MMAGAAGPAKTTSALSDGLFGGGGGADDAEKKLGAADGETAADDEKENSGGGPARSQSKPVIVLTKGMNRIGLTDPKLQLGVISTLLILALVLFLAFVAPQMYNQMRVVLEFSEANLGYIPSVLIVGSLAVCCANPVPGSHVTLLFIAYHYGVPINREDPAQGGACESTGFLFMSARAACFFHGAGFLYVVYTIASVVNFTMLRNCCGECANREAKKKGGDYVIAVDSVISAGGWQTFQAMMLLRMTPVPIGLQTLTLSVTSIGAPIEKRAPSPEAQLAAAQAGLRSTMVPGTGEAEAEAEAEAAADGSLLADVLAKKGYQIGWPYLGAALIGNIKMAIFDALVGVNVKELDKAANGEGGGDNTELIILLIGLGGLLATIGVIGMWAKRELDRMHRRSVSNGSMDLNPNAMDLDPNGVENPVSGAVVDDDPIVLDPSPMEPQQGAPPPSPEQVESNETI